MPALGQDLMLMYCSGAKTGCRWLLPKTGWAFSFSGLLTAVLRRVSGQVQVHTKLGGQREGEQADAQQRQ